MHWTELTVTDAEGASAGTLGDLVATATANLDSAVLDGDRLTEWPQFFIAAPDEEPDWDTPRGEVDWTGFADALTAARA